MKSLKVNSSMKCNDSIVEAESVEEYRTGAIATEFKFGDMGLDQLPIPVSYSSAVRRYRSGSAFFDPLKPTVTTAVLHL